MSKTTTEFREVSHSGGKVTFKVVTNEAGRRSYQISWQTSRPVPVALFAVYALPQGIPVGDVKMGGIGDPWNPPPFPGCFAVFISSDSEGRFGQQCPRCTGYWRSGGSPRVCPYCGIVEERHNFLTEAQQRYVAQYCCRLEDALSDEQDGEHVIDMDAVADAAGAEGEKPPFYYTEEQQQHQFVCHACEGYNDIIGRFAYCCQCGTRNDLQELEGKIIPEVRNRIKADENGGANLRDIASAFDSFVSQYIKQLLEAVPMIPARRNRLKAMRFHNLNSVANEIKETFGIDLFAGLKPEDLKHSALMFHRRHVYEHNGGEVDEHYLLESGDNTVRLKQALREEVESLHRFANSVSRMATNLHKGFHQIFPPEEGQIKAFHEKKARIASYRKQNGG